MLLQALPAANTTALTQINAANTQKCFKRHF